jgi:hypothetical protein
MRRILPGRVSIAIQARSSQARATISHQIWFWAKPLRGRLRRLHLPSRNYQVNKAGRVHRLRPARLAPPSRQGRRPRQSRAENPALQDPARRRTDRERPAAPLPAHTRRLALGPRHHRSIQPDPDPAPAMTPPTRPPPQEGDHQPDVEPAPTRRDSRAGTHPAPEAKINNVSRPDRQVRPSHP